MGSSRLAVVRVEAAEAELAADALWCRGATAIEERDGAAGAVELVAEVAALDSLDDLPWPVEVVEVDDSWWDGWRPFARAARAGVHLVVQPPWAPRLTARARRRRAAHRPRPGLRQRLASVHAPGPRRAGAARRARLDRARRRVRQRGAGGCRGPAGRRPRGRHRRRPGRPRGDPRQRGAQRGGGRGAEGRRSARCPVASTSSLANLLAPTLIELAAPLGERVAEHGALVVSGLLPQQTERVFAALAPLLVVGETELDGWVAATLSG